MLMDKHDVILLPSAWAELDEISDLHMELVGANSAKKITDKILSKLELLSEQPFMGRKPKYRVIAEQGFLMLVCDKYLCFYKVERDVVEVYHITDGRRDYPKISK